MWRPNRNATPEYSVQETKRLAEAGEVQLLDVRELDEWDEAHISGARLIPMSEFQQRMGEIDKNTRWVCVCHSGARSGRVADFLRANGYDAANMRGGMVSWAGSGFAYETGRGDVTGKNRQDAEDAENE
jgi:rhodanese-related sulfurtransferase